MHPKAGTEGMPLRWKPLARRCWGDRTVANFALGRPVRQYCGADGQYISAVSNVKLLTP
jgi:hypothetical protein